MKVTTEQLERCETLLTLELDPKDEQELLKKAAQRIAREVNIPGFRRGKAPFNTIVRRFGLEVVQQEAIEKMGDKLLKDALKQAEVEPYAQVQLDDVSWNPLVLKLRVPTEPKVELGDYRTIRLDAEPVEVTDEDVEDTLQKLQEQVATWTPVERPAELGDLISMTITERDGETVLIENEPVEIELVEPPAAGDTSQIDLTTPLLGSSAGESRTFTINYPEDFKNIDYAGKEITVTADISSVKAKELDPLDDDFAQQISDFETLDELKANIRDNLLRQRQQQRDVKLGSEVVDKIIETAPLLEWPVAMEEAEIDDEVERFEHRVKDAGLTLDSYLQMQQKTKEEWREELRETIVNRLKRGLVLGKVAELEGLDVSNSEILEQAKLIADLARGGEQLWRNIIASPAQQAQIASDVISSKAVERLGAIARGEAPELGAPAEAETEAEVESAPADEVSTDVVAEGAADEVAPELALAEEESAKTEEA